MDDDVGIDAANFGGSLGAGRSVNLPNCEIISSTSV